ncbi:peptidoglycan-binding protein [Acetobacteraceae bacterium]|nr:peptidoglycan-binding protein [Candidatus Parcubacteria bacterium]
MTITHSSRFVAIVAGFAVAVALIAGAFVAPKAQAAALTQTQISAIISLLQSFGASADVIANVSASLNGGTPTSGGSTGGSSTNAACYAWTRDLLQGSTGADVMALQIFLNTDPATVVSASGAGSAGMETQTFGPMTKAAVIKFQMKNGITPAAGYFGSISRAKAATMCSSTPTPTPTPGTGGALEGGEGSLDVNGTLGDVESDVDEGDSDVKVLGVELEAQDSDIMIERVDVEVTLSGTGSNNLDRYFEGLSLWLDGKKIGELDADEGDEDSDVYSFRFTGLKGVIREDDTAELYVSVDAVNNVDTGDVAKAIKVEIPENGIRAVDAEGISDTYVSAADNLEETGINVVEASSGDVDLTEGDENPEGSVVTVDEDDDTTGVSVLAFDLEANNQDVVVDAIPVGLTAATTTASFTQPMTLSGPVKRAILKMNGTTIDTKTIPGTAAMSYTVVFDDLDIDLNEGDTAEFEVLVDLNNADWTNFATGTTLYATTSGSGTGSTEWDIEDSEGDSIQPDGSVTNVGEKLIFQTSGISAAFVSASESKTFEASIAGQKDVGEFKIVVDITAVGDDMFIDKSVTADPDRNGMGSAGTGFQWATTTESTTGSTTPIAQTVTASGSTSGDSTNTFKVNEGETRRFTVTVSLESSNDGVAAVQLTGINWATADGASSANFYTSNMSDFKTDLLTLLIQ